APRPEIGSTVKLNRIKPIGPRVPPSRSPARPVDRARKSRTLPRTGTSLASQPRNMNIGSWGTGLTESGTQYIRAIQIGETPAARAISTPSGMPPPIGTRNNKKAPQNPTGQPAGRGAVGSMRGCRKSDGIGFSPNHTRRGRGAQETAASGTLDG